jgi:hypothetical protein
MFGIKKDQLVKGLCRLSCQLCAYMGTMCDCKYMKDSDDFIATGSEAGSGCPESAMAASLINAMTPEEFKTIAARASIQIFEDISPEALDTWEISKKFKHQRNDEIMGIAKGKK